MTSPPNITYHVTLNSTDDVIVVNVTKPWVEFTGLKKFTTHCARVLAMSDKGSGNASKCFYVTTDEDGKYCMEKILIRSVSIKPLPLPLFSMAHSRGLPTQVTYDYLNDFTSDACAAYFAFIAVTSPLMLRSLNEQ